MTIINIKSDQNFKEFIQDGKCVIMIHKTGCPFCEAAMPWMKEFSEEFLEKKIALVNRDNIPGVMKAFQVKMYPTFVAIENGIVRDTFFGDTKYDKVRNFVVKNI